MALVTVLTNLATRMSTECKSLRTLINNNVVDLSALTTTAKTNLVAAINELDAALDAIGGGGGVDIDDASTTSTTDTWSVAKIVSAVAAAKNEILGGAGAAWDTLSEIQAILSDDVNVVSAINTSLANRVRFDASQTLTAPQQLQACNNIGVGNPETNFVTVFETGLV